MTIQQTTGYGFQLCGGLTAYRYMTQKLTATSSTEAEFYSACSVAKVARYLRFIMKELGFTQTKPNPLYEDNDSVIKMVNTKKPTERYRHICIRYFALQDWKSQGDIVMYHIPGVINPADAITNALGWVLHTATLAD